MESLGIAMKEAAPICVFQPARYKAFVRLARQVAKLHGPRPIYIQNSRLIQPIGHPYFWADIDLGNILTPPAIEADPADQDYASSVSGVDLSFQANERDLRQLPAFVGTELVTVYDEGDELVFVGDHTEGRLFQPARPGALPAANLPTDEDRVGETVLIKDLSDLKKYVGKDKYITLRCINGQLEQVSVRGNRPYTLHKDSVLCLKGCNPDLVLTSQNFLALAGELELSLGIYRKDDCYWLKTSSRPSLINNLTTYECLFVGYA